MLGLCSEVLDITKDTKRNCTRQNSISMDCEYWSDNTSTSRTLSLNFGLTYGHDYEHFRSILDILDDVLDS
jgi:hypothetical protein